MKLTMQKAWFRYLAPALFEQRYRITHTTSGGLWRHTSAANLSLWLPKGIKKPPLAPTTQF